MAIPLRTDYTAEPLRAAAKASKDAVQARRLLALGSIYDGSSQTEAARLGAVTVQIVRDWVVKFNAQGPTGLIDRKPPGQPSRLTDADRAAVAAAVESGPMPAIHGVVRWRVIDLCQWLCDERQVVIANQTLSRELRRTVHVTGSSALFVDHAGSELVVASAGSASHCMGHDRHLFHAGLLRRTGHARGYRRYQHCCTRNRIWLSMSGLWAHEPSRA